jgi:hypothetical protein
VTFSASDYLSKLAQAAQHEFGALVDVHFDHLLSGDEQERLAAESALNAGALRALGYQALQDPPALPWHALEAARMLEALVLRPGTQVELEKQITELGLANSNRVREAMGTLETQGAC